MGETFGVWLDSWSTIRRDFRKDAAKAAPYDLSKIPEIFDKVKFDARHNHRRLDLGRVFPRFDDLVDRSQTLSAAVTPLEFGGAADARRNAAWRVSRALLDKISQDLRTARGGDGDANSGLHFQLDDDPQHLADSEIKSSWRAVRSRLYFTSESHLHALLAALRLPADDEGESPVQESGRRWLSRIPELSYLSHIVFRLWENLDLRSEDPEKEEDPARYMVEVSFSPGTPFLPVEIAPTPGFAPAAAVPTLPLEPFAYVPSRSLEAYFAAKPSASSSEGLAAAETKYAALAAALERHANGAGAASPLSSPPSP